MKKALLSIFLILFSSNLVLAQINDFQGWGQITNTSKIGQWLLFLEAQGRLGDDISNLERTLVRPAIGYQLNPNLQLYLGYAWTPTYVDSFYEDDFRNEHRVWQQAVIQHEFLDFDILHRIRQEQRFISEASSVANRTRYLLKASYSLEDDRGISMYHELFVNLHGVRRGPKGGIDRYRFFIGPYFKSEGATYEIGYLGELGKEFRDDERMIHSCLLYTSDAADE